jgi:hypothetical protein
VARKRNRDAIVWFDEAARRFSVTPETLREWVSEGRFPAPRSLGARPFYTEEDLAYAVHFADRWRPQDVPGRPRKDTDLSGKARKQQDSGGTEGVS